MSNRYEPYPNSNSNSSNNNSNQQQQQQQSKNNNNNSNNEFGNLTAAQRNGAFAANRINRRQSSNNNNNNNNNKGPIGEDNYGGMRNEFKQQLNSNQVGFQTLEGNNNNNSDRRGPPPPVLPGEKRKRNENGHNRNNNNNNNNNNNINNNNSRRSASPDFDRRDSQGGNGGGNGGGRDNGWRGGPDRNARSPPPSFSPNNRNAPPPRRDGGGGGGRDRGSNNRESGSRESTRGGGGRGPSNSNRNSKSGPSPIDEESTEYIHNRTKKERPCRTLFVRNLKFPSNFKAPTDEVRDRFEKMGEIKTFFDLITERGMVFITYYDIRAAMLAKESLQGIEVSGRAMDVHYSLPREIDLKKRCDRDRSQGTLSLSIPNSTTSLNEEELFSRFGTCGDIKSILPNPKNSSDRLIDYFDSRGAEKAFDELNGQDMAGGTMELAFEWDTLPPPISNPIVHIDPPVRRGYPSGPNSQRPQERQQQQRYQSPPPLPPPQAPIPSLNDRLSQALRVQKMLSGLSGNPLPPPPAPLDQQIPPQMYQQGLPQQQPNYNNPYSQSPIQQQQQLAYGVPLPSQVPYGISSSNGPPPLSQQQYQPNPYSAAPPLASQGQVPQYNYGQPSIPDPYANNVHSSPPPFSSLPPPVGSGINLPAPLLALLSKVQPSLPAAATAAPSSSLYNIELPHPYSQTYDNGGYSNIPPGENVYPTSNPVSSLPAPSAPAQVQALLALLAQQQAANQ